MVSHNFLKQKRNGFTLIEVMVAVAIMGIVSSFIVISMGGGKQDALRAAQKFVFDVRAAQNKALAPTDTPSCIYGVKINSPTTYFVYYNPSCASGHQYDLATSVVLASYTLQKGVSFVSFGNDIAFEAPEPITYINGVLGAPPITVIFQKQAGQRSVSINRFGLIEIQ